jgi:hypothetical protein
VLLEGRDNMIERVHQHIMTELQLIIRTDTVFVLTAIILNLLILGINSAISNASREKTNVFIAMFIFVFLTVVVNLVAISGLLKGKQTRTRLLNGLLKIYKDQGVEGYYDPAILLNYNARYNLFILAVAFVGLIAIVVPFVIR